MADQPATAACEHVYGTGRDKDECIHCDAPRPTTTGALASEGRVVTFTPHTAVVASLDGGTADLAQLGEAVARPTETATVAAPTTAGTNEPGRAEPLKGNARPALEIHVFGLPAPQGSKDPYRNQHTGRIHLKESSPNVKPWRLAVKHAALDRLDSDRDGPLLDGPVFIYTVYSFTRPTTHYRTGRNAHLLRDNAPAYPITRNRNDLEKLDRATRDALTDAGVWTDDSLVVHHDSWKVFTREHADALPVAGAVIRIYRIDTGR